MIESDEKKEKNKIRKIGSGIMTAIKKNNGPIDGTDGSESDDTRGLHIDRPKLM